MRKHVGTTLRFFLGIVFLILGVVGSLLPVLQGWIFFLLAALMFFPNHPRTEKGLQKFKKRMPRFVAWLRRLGFGADDEDSLANLDVADLLHHHHQLHHEHRPPGPTPVPDAADTQPQDRQRAAR